MEHEIGEYPESAAEIMLETVEELQRNGMEESALELSGRVIADFTGEDAGYGYLHRIELLFQLGRDDEAEAALAELWGLGEEAEHAAHLVAELLDERGELQRALRWSDRGLAPQLDRGAPIEDLGALMAARWRTGLRSRLGLAPDRLDTSVKERSPMELIHEVANAEEPELPVEDRAVDGDQVILSHIVRSDVTAAHAAGLLTGFDAGEAVTADTYFRGVELNRQQMRRETAFSKGRDVPLSMAEIRAFAEKRGTGVLTEEVRSEAAMDKYTRGGEFQVWLPERNQPCWCASGRKYKKCCGRP